MPTIKIKATGEVVEATDKCYLEYVDGYLTCTYKHKPGDKCLMDKGLETF
jgi:hypothetical protein